VVSPERPPPFRSILKLLFFGSSEPLSTPEKPNLYRKNLRFSDAKDLTNEVGGNKEIRGVVFDLSVLNGIQQGKTYYFQNVSLNVYNGDKQLRLTKYTKITPATDDPKETSSLLKLFNLDALSLEGALPLPSRVNLIGIVLQRMVWRKRTKIGCSSGFCMAMVVNNTDHFLLPIDESHTTAVFFNVILYSWKGLRTLCYDEYSFMSYQDPRTDTVNSWYNSQVQQQTQRLA
jgi:hypothetical protein